MHKVWLLAWTALLAISLAFVACGDGSDSDGPTATFNLSPLPSPVEFRQTPERVALEDPAFEPLSGARAFFGRLGGAVYQIEIPDDWNGRLVLYMHGYGEIGPEAGVSAPDFRRYLIGQGIAWGASSFSSTMNIPGRAADETAALWDFFARKYGRPSFTYITGESMGGAATHIAAERYPDRFDGALGFCGAAGLTPGLEGGADFFAAAAFVAGVTQEEFENRIDLGKLIRERILPALDDQVDHDRFESIMIDLTGGPRAFDREGFHLEEEINWHRSEQAVTVGLSDNDDRTYELGPLSDVASDAFNDGVIRLTANEGVLSSFTYGNDITGDLQMPVLTLHTTGDGQVPIEQARLLRRLVDEAGKTDLLVQRVFRDLNHCGFSIAEWEASLEDLMAWVENGVKPEGEDLLVEDLRTLGGRFEITPREGTAAADAVAGASARAVVRGKLTLDGEPFDARWLGAIVRRGGLVTPCQVTLPPVEDGRYEISVFADAESSGCGAPGGEILLWTFTRGKKLFSQEPVAWPGDVGTASFDTSFSVSRPEGDALRTTDFNGAVYNESGESLPARHSYRSVHRWRTVRRRVAAAGRELHRLHPGCRRARLG
ncbi:MAG: DUF6351 family protein [Dehalococcoidia bacterium]